MHVKTNLHIFNPTQTENIFHIYIRPLPSWLSKATGAGGCALLSGAIFGSGLCEIEVPGSRTACAGSALNKRQRS